MFDKQDPVIIINGISIVLTGAPVYDFNEPDQDINAAVDGTRIITKYGDYFAADITLYSYDETLYNTLKSASEVIFCPYGDYRISENYLSPRCTMLVKQLKPFHVNNKVYADALLLKLISKSYYTLEKYASGI